MSGKRYTEEFKIEAVKQVVDRGHSVSSVSKRLGIAHVLGMLSEGMDDPDQILDQLPNIWSVYKAFKFRTSCRSVSEPIDVACSFCGRHNSDVEKMLGGASAAICDECVEMCAEIMTEECGDFELCVEEDEYDGET